MKQQNADINIKLCVREKRTRESCKPLFTREYDDSRLGNMLYEKI